MPTKAELETLILEAISTEGNLMTIGSENGVDIDAHGPWDGNQTHVEGWHRHEHGRHFFQARLTVDLEEYSPDYGEIDDDWDHGDGEDEEDV